MRTALLPFAAAVLAAACSAQRSAPTGSMEQRMSFDRIDYTVMVAMGTADKMTLAASGSARYEQHLGQDGRGIGVYEGDVPAGDLAALPSLLGGLASFPDHAGRILPDDDYREIAVTAGGAVTTKVVGSHEQVDARLAALLNQLDTLRAAVQSHPRQVLGAAVSDVTMGEGGAIALTLTLESRGGQSVVCRSPVALVGVQDGWVQVSLWPRVPRENLQGGDIVRARADRVDDLRKPPSFEARLELAGGTSAAFRVHAKLPRAKPGPSVVEVSYASYATGGASFLPGEIQTKLVALDVPK